MELLTDDEMEYDSESGSGDDYEDDGSSEDDYIPTSEDEDQLDSDGAFDSEAEDPPSPVVDPVFLYYKDLASCQDKTRRGNPNTVIETDMADSCISATESNGKRDGTPGERPFSFRWQEALQSPVCWISIRLIDAMHLSDRLSNQR